MAPPLLSEHKRAFAGKRLCQNVLGGLRVVGVPCPLILIQATLFCLPVPILCAVKLTLGSEQPFVGLAAFGVALFLLDLLLTLLLLQTRRSNSVRPTTPSDGRTLLAEEDLVAYEGFFASSTWTFVAPNVALSVTHAAALLLSPIACALALPLLFDPSNALALRILSIFVLCSARFSAVFSVPPEIATFQTHQGKAALYRPFYVALPSLINVAGKAWVSAEWEVVSGGACGLCLALLPLGWALGFLPPLDALFPWLLEAVLVVLGGCPSLSYFASLLALLLAILYSLLVFIAGAEKVWGIALQCFFGHLLLLDAGRVFSLGVWGPSAGCVRKIGWKRLLLGNWGTCLCSLFLVLFLLAQAVEDEPWEWAFAGAGATFGVLLLLLQSRVGQKCLASSAALSLMLRRALTISLQLWLSLILQKRGEERKVEGLRSLRHLLTIALNTRAFALGVNQPKGTTLDFFVTAALRQCTGRSSLPNSVHFSTLLFFVSFGRGSGGRLCGHLGAVARITHALFASPLFQKKARIAALCVLGSPLSAWSVVVGSFVEGATLTPLFTLPLFLPGFPRPSSFWKGTCLPPTRRRPAGSEGLEEAIYAALAPQLLTNFLTEATKAGIRLCGRECFVARHDDRLLFLRILGSGWNFMYVAVKGLELEEQTSCHHQEAAWMDEILERDGGAEWCLEQDWNWKRRLTVVEPLLRLRVPAFSEARATIPPLSTPHEKDVLERMFFRAFSFLWLKEKGGCWGTGEGECCLQAQSEEPLPLGVGRGAWRRRESLPPPPETTQWRREWVRRCVGEGSPPQELTHAFHELTQSLWALLHGQNVVGDVDLWRYFDEEFLLVQERVRLRAMEEHDLSHLTQKAARYACKLTLEELYAGGGSGGRRERDEETLATLLLYERAFTFCSPAETPLHIGAKAKEGDRVLCMAKGKEGLGQLSTFAYDAAGLLFHLARLDKSVVEGIWANLSLELLYLTSDDDERFSIQHDRHLMRNLITECAEAPLGYPVFEATFSVDLFNDFSLQRV